MNLNATCILAPDNACPPHQVTLDGILLQPSSLIICPQTDLDLAYIKPPSHQMTLDGILLQPRAAASVGELSTYLAFLVDAYRRTQELCDALQAHLGAACNVSVRSTKLNVMNDASLRTCMTYEYDALQAHLGAARHRTGTDFACLRRTWGGLPGPRVTVAHTHTLSFLACTHTLTQTHTLHTLCNPMQDFCDGVFAPHLGGYLDHEFRWLGLKAAEAAAAAAGGSDIDPALVDR